MAHSYFLMKLPGEPDRILVWDTRTLTVGRAQENAIVLPDTDISRRHAIFSKDGDRYEVGDHQTGNGTFRNGERVTGSQTMRDGDVITIGKLQLEFCQSEEHPAKRGMKLDYASHLMTPGALPDGGNPNATMVGMDVAADDDPFVIEHNDGSGSDLFADEALGLDVPPVPPVPVRDLDIDVGGETGATTSAAPRAAAPDPNDSSGTDPLERMRRLKSLHAEGLITDEEFEQKRAQVLKDV